MDLRERFLGVLRNMTDLDANERVRVVDVLLAAVDVHHARHAHEEENN